MIEKIKNNKVAQILLLKVLAIIGIAGNIYLS